VAVFMGADEAGPCSRFRSPVTPSLGARWAWHMSHPGRTVITPPCFPRRRKKRSQVGPPCVGCGVRVQRVGPVPCLCPARPVGTAPACWMCVLTGQHGHSCLITEVPPWAREVPGTWELSLPRHFLRLPGPHFLFVLTQFV